MTAETVPANQADSLSQDPCARSDFTWPSTEAWGLVRAFNGEKPLFGVPHIPGITEQELVFEPHLRGPPGSTLGSQQEWRRFQRLRTLRNLPTLAIEVWYY